MDVELEPGTLLAAAPDMLDPNFMHAIVLMCRHAPEGAYGLVVNRPATVTLDVLLPDHPVLGRVRFPVHAGGPVGLDTLQFVHQVPREVRGGVPVAGGLYLGGELEDLSRLLARRGLQAARDVRAIVGYSGWGAGQLEGEIASGSWLPARLDRRWVFRSEEQRTWRALVRSLGRQAAGLEDLPPDPSWN